MSAHDDRPADDDGVERLDTAEQAVATRLTAVLSDRAGTVVVADQVFDPARPSMVGLGEGVEPSRAAAASLRSAPDVGMDPPDALAPLPIAGNEASRRRWIVWIAGAAAAAVLVAAIVAINAVRQPSVRTGDQAPLVGPDAAWAPTWVPDGLELWSLQTEHGDPRSIIAGVSTDDIPDTVVQLLESATSDAKILLSITTEGAVPPSGTPITIRGVSGSWGTGSGPSGVSLRWSESGAVFGAEAVGLDRAAAVEQLDGLLLSDPADPAAGFGAPPDGSWTVHTDDPRGRPRTEVVVASFGYDRGRPTGGRLPLQVLTSGGGSPVSGVPGYLPVAFLGSLDDDGVARAFTPGAGDRPAVSYTVWPDGRTVYSSGPELDEAAAARIAESIEPLTRAQLELRADEVSAKLGAAGVLASADLPSGTVEVVGDGQPSAICLTVAGRRTCRTSESLTGADAATDVRLMGTVTIDGTWYVFAASDDGPVELGVGRPGSFTGSGTAVATTVEPGAEVVVDPGPEPTSEGPGDDVEAIVGEVPAGPGPGSPTSDPPNGSTPEPGTTTGTGPPNRSVPFESAVLGRWTLALLVAPPDADAAWASFTNNMVTFPRPSP